MAGSYSWPLLVLVGVLVAVAAWSLLYGLLWYFGGGEARVRARIKQFVTEEDASPVTAADERKQVRTDIRPDGQTPGRKILSELIFQEAKRRYRQGRSALNGDRIRAYTGERKCGSCAHLVAARTQSGAWVHTGGDRFHRGIMLGRSYLRYLGKRRIMHFEEQLPDTLSILASSVRGGFSLFQALQLIAKEASEPSKSEFLRVMQQISLGAPMDDALADLARRVPTEDVDILVTAIGLQHQTGGNLAHVLDIVATTVRERHRVQREIRSLTAQVRFSAVLLGALPFLLAGALFVISPTYIGHIFVWGWVLLLPGGAVALSLIGMLIMRRISAIDV